MEQVNVEFWIIAVTIVTSVSLTVAGLHGKGPLAKWNAGRQPQKRERA
ncbi:hypothetical protein [Aurantiacibacter luteus]|nr:hypothetical protein [Aurantiacibacter luteus]